MQTRIHTYTYTFEIGRVLQDDVPLRQQAKVTQYPAIELGYRGLARARVA